MKRRIAIFRKNFLPITETFIYEELIHIKQYQPVVITFDRLNEYHFPFESVLVTKSDGSALEEIIKENKIKILHARFGTNAVDLLPLKQKLEIPMITSFHGYDVPIKKKPDMYYQQLKQLFQIGECFTTTSKYMKKQLIRLGCPTNKIHVQRSGIDLTKFPFRTKVPGNINKRVKILTVGRLVRKKGMDYLLKAVKKVNQEHPVELRIIGDGPQKNRLQRLARKLGIENNITFCGIQEHGKVKEAMEKAHIFCLASITTKKGNQEGIPNVLKEAMAVGLPVVSTLHAGIPELIQDGKNGCLVPEKDTGALAKAILHLIRSPESWTIISHNNRKKIEKEYNSVIQTRKLEALYGKLLTKKTSPKKGKEGGNKAAR